MAPAHRLSLCDGDCFSHKMRMARCGYPRAQVDQVWQQYTAGNCGVVVCHIDSGTHWNANNWYNAGEYGGIPLVDDDGNGECTAP